MPPFVRGNSIYEPSSARLDAALSTRKWSPPETGLAYFSNQHGFGEGEIGDGLSNLTATLFVGNPRDVSEVI